MWTKKWVFGGILQVHFSQDQAEMSQKSWRWPFSRAEICIICIDVSPVKFLYKFPANLSSATSVGVLEMPKIRNLRSHGKPSFLVELAAPEVFVFFVYCSTFLSECTFMDGWQRVFGGEKSRVPSVTAENWRPRLCMRAPVFWPFEKLTCNNIIWTYVGRASSLYCVVTYPSVA